MNLLLLLDMAASMRGDEVAVTTTQGDMTTSQLLGAAWGGADLLGGASTVAFVGTNGTAFPIALFASAAAGIPLAPLNYRLAPDQLHELVDRLDDPVVVAEGDAAVELEARGCRVIPAETFVSTAMAHPAEGIVPDESDEPSLFLFTSGTTAAPKAAVLRHRHLTSYVIGTVEFASAPDDEAALVSVPPYHVAGVANLLSNLYAGRRIVYLSQFDAEGWVATVRAEGITNAMVVPTMLARIGDVLALDGLGLPTLARLSYGGARTPSSVLELVMDLLPEVALTNAYGLTETSSTIAVLGPDDHRAARGGDPAAVARLSSAGKVLPTVEVEVRDGGGPVATGAPGEIWVRGEQVSGEYTGMTSVHDAGGWFPTRDRGWLDADGYLFIEGRSDDTIIRGGENIAPAEIEDAIVRHPAVDDCAVVGLPDDEWGQVIAAVIVLVDGATLSADDVRAFARETLRGSKTPEVIRFVASLPYTETGKLLRREVQSDLGDAR